MAAPATSAEAEESLARGQALEIGWRDVSYQYPDTSTPALDGVTETIPAGELAVIMGPSGCGKSTLGLTLNGVVPRTTGGRRRGAVAVGGRDPLTRELAEVASDVGIVLQDPDAQLCTITVRDEISFGPQNLLVERGEILRRMRELAELVGLGGRLDDAVFELSGGQKQRVAIASVLAVRPKVLVLDEPTANLDPAGSREVLRLLTDVIGEQDMTVLAIEHDPGDLLASADRLIVMDRGEIVASGPPGGLTAERGEEFAARGVRLPAATLFWLHTRPPDDDGAAGAPLRVSDIDFDRLIGPPRIGAQPDAPPVAATGDDAVLRAEGIHFAYPGGRQVLNDLNIHIGRGEVVALMGPNGAGKSTFASLLVGLNRPTAGVLEVARTDATRQPIRELARRVGYVFQYPEHQFVADRVIDEITISLERLSRDRSDIAARARECLERFDLEAHAERHPFRLSLGQKRRLSIAAMAVYRPDLLVLDEPTFGQDRAHTDQLVDAIADLNRDGSAVLLITHDLQLASAVADRVAVVDEGRVVFDGHASVLLERLREEPRWGLWPIEEYELWREVRRRRADVPFTVSAEALARYAQGGPA